MTLRYTFARQLASVSIVAVTTIAAAATPTFQITEVFSNLDGSVQFVQLTETAGFNGQHYFGGLTLTSTHAGIVKTFTFPTDLPSDQTAGMSIVIASTPGGLSVNYGGRYWNVVPDFVVPARFLPTDGGTIDFAGVDQLSYGSLPTDGWHALQRDGTIAPGTLRPILPPEICRHAVPPGCGIDRPILPSRVVRAVEYYNPARDHYFMSAAAPDIDALDSGRTSGWHRTGASFPVSTIAALALGLHPVCRYLIPPESGDSHFFSAFPEECAAVRSKFPDFVLEDEAAFYVTLPDPVTGLCPFADDIFFDEYRQPVFRLWNRRADSNHRYTTDLAIRNSMIERGYIPEGYGPDGVAFCL